jgi:hypothetical protein
LVFQQEPIQKFKVCNLQAHKAISVSGSMQFTG